MYEFRESELIFDDKDKEQMLESSNVPFKPFLVIVLVLWVLLLIIAPKNGLLIGGLTLFSVFILFFPLIISAVSKGALEDNKKIIRWGILTEKEKVLHANASPSYCWYLSDKKDVIHRSYDSFNNAEINDFIEISRTRHGDFVLHVKKIGSQRLNYSKIENSDWETIT